MESGDDAAADAIIFDYRNADLSNEDSSLCDYAVKLTLAPGAVQGADVAALRGLGFSDAAITVAAQVVSYFNYINRIADGLGVDAEEWMDELGESEWREQKADNY